MVKWKMKNHWRPHQQLFRFKEVQRKTGLSSAMLETHNQTPYAQNYLFKFVTFYMHILRFIALHGIY